MAHRPRSGQGYRSHGALAVTSEPGAAWLTDDERIEAQRKKQVGLASLPPAKYPG